MRTLNLTEKLKDNSKPTITIGEVTIEVNNDATSVLGLMELVTDEPTEKDFLDSAKLIFSPEEYKKLMDLKLSFENFMIVIGAAMELVTGTSEHVGE